MRAPAASASPGSAARSTTICRISGGRRRAGQHGERRRPPRGARRLSSAARRLQGAQGQARGGARRKKNAAACRHADRQHGALALGAARSRQGACRRQHSRLHAQGHRSGQDRVDDPHRGRQGRRAGDPAAQRDDEVHHGQSDLERAALDHPQRIPAGAGSAIRARSTASGSRSRTRPTARSASISRRARRTRSAASASISRTGSWSISTTRRRSTCSPRSSAPTATAACGCRIRRNTPRCCCRSRSPSESYTAERIHKMYGSDERTINFKTPIPVHLTYQTAFVDDAGPVADAAGHLRPRPDDHSICCATAAAPTRRSPATTIRAASRWSARLPSRPDDRGRRAGWLFQPGAASAWPAASNSAARRSIRGGPTARRTDRLPALAGAAAGHLRSAGKAEPRLRKPPEIDPKPPQSVAKKHTPAT